MIPNVLRQLHTWLVWRLEPNPKPDLPPLKVPYYVSGKKRSGTQGSDADRAELASYDKAEALVASGKYDGLGLAFVPGMRIVGLDFDNCVDAAGKIDPRVERVCEGTYTEVSPSGTGIHSYFLGSLKSRKDNADKADRIGGVRKAARKDGLFDVEFFGDSGFLTVTGNETADSAMWGHDVTPLSNVALALYNARFAASMNNDLSTDVHDMSGLMPRQGWSLEEARGYLNDCDAEASRESWLKALMAIHHEFDGSEEALDLVDEWSSTASSYGGRGDVETRWRSFKGSSGGAPITASWLLFWRSEHLKRLKYNAEEEHVEVIKATADHFALREKVCLDIARDERLDDVARGQLARVVLTAFKALGKVYSIAEVRKMLKPVKAKTDGGHDLAPPWLHNWVYVTDADQFYRKDSAEWLSVQGFNTKFTRMMHKDDKGNPVKEAAAAAREDFGLVTVTKAQYIPWAGAEFELEGVSQVNTYRPSSVPDAVRHLSDAGRKAAEVVRRHLLLLCGGRAEEAAVILDWLAFNVQNPGVKVRWSPLIKGIQGDGKTLLGTLLAATMGRSNVKNVSSKVLGTDFTSWAVGACVAVLEEVKLTGHNRYDILNAIKPMITNGSIEVHKKGQDADGSVINVTNYICFTNYNDALPLEDTDRRYMVIFSPFSSVEEMAAGVRVATGYKGDTDEVTGAYFDELHAAVELQGGELRRWMLDYKVRASFRPNGRAPMTDEKLVMIGMSITEDERAVREALEMGGEGVTEALFSSACLLALAQALDTEFMLNTSAIPKLLGRMGYTRMPNKLWWNQKSHVIWTRNAKNSEGAEIRALLDKTLGKKPSADCEDLFGIPTGLDF